MMHEVWKVLAGIAMFLLGMRLLEDALRTLTGRKAKLFLRKQTVNPLSAIGGGAVMTGLVQSSSVVNLIVLGLVGAGTIPMANALAVVLGTNVGTTLNTWIIATVGFKVEIEKMALPAIAVAGLLRAAFPGKNRIYNWLGFLLGLGFLFLGLDMMKTGMEHSISMLDLSSLHHYPAIVYLLAGVLLTSLTQSGAATVAILLSALNANVLELHTATAVVLGSEVGTTLKLIIAASGKDPSMKRVALGNLIFNLAAVAVVFIFLKHVNYFITGIAAVRDPLMALAFFQTLINLVAVVLFYPLLGRLARFLESRYRDVQKETRFISEVPVEEEDLAVDALEQETTYFLKAVMQYCCGIFDTDRIVQFDRDIPSGFFELDLPGRYNFIKQLHGDIYTYYVALQNTVKSPEQTLQLERLVASVRNGMYAAKSMKDAEPDIAQLRNSGNDAKYRLYLQAREKTAGLLAQLALPFQPGSGEGYFQELVAVYHLVRTSYNDSLQELYKNAPVSLLSEMEISTVINFNREIYSAFKSLALALKDALLTSDEAKYFDDLPGFIR